MFDLILYVPTTTFQLCRDGSSLVEPVVSLAQGHSAVTPVRLQRAAPQPRVKHSTTEPLNSLSLGVNNPHEVASFELGVYLAGFMEENTKHCNILNI